MTRSGQLRRGFTIFEAAIVTVIIGVGIIGMLQLLAAGTMANSDSTDLTSAMGLANHIHEMSLGVTYSNIMTMDAKTYSPPVDARGVTLSAMSGWQQAVTVDYVNPNNLQLTVAKSPAQPTARTTVTISHNNQAVYAADWLSTATTWP